MFSKFTSKLLIFSSLACLLTYFYFFRIPKKASEASSICFIAWMPKQRRWLLFNFAKKPLRIGD